MSCSTQKGSESGHGKKYNQIFHVEQLCFLNKIKMLVDKNMKFGIQKNSHTILKLNYTCNQIAWFMEITANFIEGFYIVPISPSTSTTNY